MPAIETPARNLTITNWTKFLVKNCNTSIMAKIIKSTTRKRITPTYTPNLDSGIAAALVPSQNAVYIHDAYTESMSSSI